MVLCGYSEKKTLVNHRFKVESFSFSGEKKNNVLKNVLLCLFAFIIGFAKKTTFFRSERNMTELTTVLIGNVS